jgi:hypothetical protein
MAALAMRRIQVASFTSVRGVTADAVAIAGGAFGAAFGRGVSYAVRNVDDEVTI